MQSPDLMKFGALYFVVNTAGDTANNFSKIFQKKLKKYLHRALVRRIFADAKGS